MRWTSRARFLFLAPAVVWVLAFTVFPLGYSLYIAFLKIENKTEITRERVPMFDKEGNPVMLANGKQRMRTIIHKETKVHHHVRGAQELPAHLQGPPRSGPRSGSP